MWCRQKHKNHWIMGTEGTSEKTLRLNVVLSCLEISVCVCSQWYYLCPLTRVNVLQIQYVLRVHCVNDITSQ